MGLYANITAVEASQSLVTAKAIAIAMGDSKSHADCIYRATGNSKLAKRIQIEGIKARNNHG
jgi:actin-related protein